ncbi:hypothetical protein [Corynebacterium epidermidicanis]|uniref:Uncharacterized protein n=1 Tax=Corynebacterium epidermidicanis TaxID=1050174 RepID=A0A0G3GMZ8_9CORY|nr:hypothetical protein [Corynebacterium epidermidicanis]AKK01920.1 hypothetical protein CEPID_00120 [Corynebacterium epidermidicanis]
MNTKNLRLAVNVARSAFEAVNDYRERKAAETYDALSHAAENYTIAELADLGRERIDAGKEATVATVGAVAENARVRLEKARAEAEDRAAVAAKETRKTRKQLVKDLTKQKKQAIKKAQKAGLVKKDNKGKKLGTAFTLIAILSALAGALYWFIFRPEKPGTVPPRVEEHAGEGSTLVYSTQTPAEGAPEPTAEDREFLDSLDEQLAKHRVDAIDKAAAEVTPVNDSEVADDHVDEALEGDIARLDDLTAQAEEAEADFDKKQGK